MAWASRSSPLAGEDGRAGSTWTTTTRSPAGAPPWPGSPWPVDAFDVALFDAGRDREVDRHLASAPGRGRGTSVQGVGDDLALTATVRGRFGGSTGSPGCCMTSPWPPQVLAGRRAWCRGLARQCRHTSPQGLGPVDLEGLAWLPVATSSRRELEVDPQRSHRGAVIRDDDRRRRRTGSKIPPGPPPPPPPNMSPNVGEDVFDAREPTRRLRPRPAIDAGMAELVVALPAFSSIGQHRVGLGGFLERAFSAASSPGLLVRVVLHAPACGTSFLIVVCARRPVPTPRTVVVVALGHG